MYNFFDILERSSGKTEKRLLDDIICFQRNAQPFFRMVKKYYKENPNATEQDIYEYFYDFFAEINFQIVKLPVIKNATLEYNICKYLNRNDTDRKEAYEKIIKEEQRKGKPLYSEDGIRNYNSNRLSATRLITIQALKELREKKDSFPEEDRKEIEMFFKLSKSVQSNHKRTLNSKDRRNFEELKDLFSKDEYTQFSIFLKKCEPLLEKNLKEDYIQSLTTLGSMFKQMDLLGDYCKDYDELLSRLNLPGLNYPLSEDENNTISLENLFNKDNLQKLSPSQLSMLNTFWLNRFTKEVEYINKAFFIVKNVGAWDKIREKEPTGKNKYIDPSINKEELKGLYSKMNFLHEITNMIFYKFKNQEGETIVEEIPGTDKKRLVKRIDAEPVLEQLEKEIGKEYTDYFKKVQPNEGNSLIEDIEDYRIMENAVHNTYRAKDKNIIAILSNLYETGFAKNWGIIKESGYKNSRMVLLGIDVGDLNMPVRLHVEKSLVKDFLRGAKGNTVIQIYDGEKDFDIHGEYIRTPLLMPIFDKQRCALKELMEIPVHHHKNLIEHLSFFTTGNYPEHLKIEVISKKKNKRKLVKKIPPKKYIDLSTNDEFVEGSKGEMIKIDLSKDKKEERTHE